MYTEILLIFTLIVINGLFSMSEIAIVSARKFKLENEAKRGNGRAKAALGLANSPNEFLSTVQIGITLIGILTGLFGGEGLQDRLAFWLSQWPTIEPYSRSISIGIVVVVITYFSLVVGELLPKRLGLLNPEAVAKLVALPMQLIARITHPFIKLLTFSTSTLLRLFNLKDANEGRVTEEEIKAIIQEGTDAGEIQQIEQDIVERVFSLGDINVASLMVHRTDIVWLDTSADFAELKREIDTYPHTAYPVAEEDLDYAQGLVYLKDLYVSGAASVEHLKRLVKPVLFVPEAQSAYRLLEQFKQSKIKYALVKDEYGAVQGLVSMSNLLNALVGDVESPAGEEAGIVPREDGSYLVDGLLPFFEFLQYLEVEYDVKPAQLSFNTVGGFVLDQLKRIPKTGEKFQWRGYDIEVMDTDNGRVDKILVKKREG
ncbi:MAG: hemolysin family protein [Bernardetiaceae bacterium]|jgi:putative hemolysin|nr:hemolysin family protein [Bernardetiaceae bacterium]